jgi:osmotically-inducible protein OsmY
LGGNLGGAGRTGTTGMQNNRQNERRAQYVTRISFAPPQSEPGATAQVRSAVEQSLMAIAPNGASVTMDGSTAVLTGTVASAHDRKLAERMALLEPGVRSVRNELAVSGDSSSKL